MIYKAELVVGGITVNVTDDIKNWDDITMSLKRSDYGGVIRSYSDKFEFVGVAYDILRQEYRSKLINPSAELVLSTRNNNHLYDERFRCTLDFASLTDDGYTISMNALDSSLAALIKANKSQTYDIPVNELVTSDFDVLRYDHLMMQNNLKYIPISSNIDDIDIYHIDWDNEINGGYLNAGTSSFSSSLYGDAEVYKEGIIEYNKNVLQSDKFKQYFIKALTAFDLKLKAKFTIEPATYPDGSDVRFYILSGKEEDFNNADTNGDGYIDNQNINIIYNSGSLTYGAPLIIDVNLEKEIRLHKNELLWIGFHYKNQGGTYFADYSFIIKKFVELSFQFNSRSEPEYITLIKPISLLSRILKEITNTDIDCYIDMDNNFRLSNCFLMAAESIRGFSNSKVHTSFKKFSEWMEAVFGYIYKIENEGIRFMHRDTLYNNAVSKTISERELNGFSFSMDNNLLFSGVKIGYEKQDYESVNGRDEFRFTNSYSTGSTLNDKILELISPYRADAYGMEFLIRKRSEKTTDDSSDNDIFFICAKYGSYSVGGVLAYAYLPMRDGYTISGVISPLTMFNVMYSPRSMVEANKSFIGACTNSVKFTASEGNADITINGVSEKEPVAITDEERLFTPYKVELNTSNIELPEDPNGLISVSYQGEEYKGYVSDIDTRFTREEECKYTLMVKTIN